MNGKNFRWALVIPALLLGACSLPGLAAPAAGPQAWFDAPLPGTLLPLTGAQLVSHFSDPGGLSEIELTVNGAVAGAFPVSNPGGSLVTDTRGWLPPGPGRYALWVRARNQQGTWSDYARTHVVVADPDERTTAAGTPAPTPAGESGFEDPSLSAGVLYADRCDPRQVTIRVKARHPAGIKALVFFFRLEDAQDGGLSPWNEGLAMNLGADGFYTSTLTGALLADRAGFGFDRAVVHYQFVIQPMSGELVRSQVYSDLQLLACGALPPPARSTPTRPPHLGP